MYFDISSYRNRTAQGYGRSQTIRRNSTTDPGRIAAPVALQQLQEYSRGLKAI